jgi:DNA-binding response OmpR family regulator
LRLIGEILDPTRSPADDVAGYAVRLRHAVATPVANIQGYVEHLLEDSDGVSITTDLQRIHSAASQLVTLADGVERRYLARAAAACADGAKSRSQAADAGTVDAAGGTSPRGVVLVVDDDESNRALLARRVELHGHRVLLARDGCEGLTLARSEPVDVILLDVLMPDLSGYEVLARLKQDDALKGIPVLMITALDDPASVIRCIALGAEDYLAKPFDPMLLRARISCCLNKKRARDFELAYLRGVSVVTAAAEAVENGTFDPATLDEVAERSDALGNLARLFRRMGVEVATRERRLRRQVEQLTIAIDERKKAAQVSEITESDYFRDLQARVRGLASRRSGADRK